MEAERVTGIGAVPSTIGITTDRTEAGNGNQHG
jgi:hypothetical protein